MLRSRFVTAVLNVGGIHYVFRDTFATALAAGSVHGSAAEPGPGTRVVADTGNKLSITGGRAVVTSGTGLQDPQLGYGALPRVAGRTVKYTVKWGSRGHTGIKINVAHDNPVYGILEQGGALNPVQPAATGYVQVGTGADYTLWITLFASGAAYWIKGGTGTYTYASPTLLYVTSRYNDSPVYIYPIIGRITTLSMEVDNIEVVDRPGLGSRQLLASVYQANPATGVNHTTVANAIHTLSFTLPGSPSAGDKVSLHYRQQNATNYLEAYVVRNAGNTAWDFNLDKVVDGSATNLINATGVGTPDRIVVICHGSEHWAFTEAANVATQRGAKQTDAAFNTSTEVGAWFDAGTVTLLESFARTWSL